MSDCVLNHDKTNMYNTEETMWQQHTFHIIYKITSMDCISAATRHCWYLERNDGYEHCKIHFQIKEVVLLETFLKLRKGTFLSTKFTSLFTISQHRWPHVAVMMTHIALLAERISAKNRKYMPASLSSLSPLLLLLTSFLSAPPLRGNLEVYFTRFMNLAVTSS